MELFKKLFRGREETKPVLAVPLLPPEPKPEPIKINEISPQDLKLRIDNGDNLVIVDMRQSWEYQYGHIPGARHIFVNEIPARYAELPKDADVILQCWHGNTSLGVAGFLIKQGWSASQVASLKGGIAGWVQTHGQNSLVTD